MNDTPGKSGAAAESSTRETTKATRTGPGALLAEGEFLRVWLAGTAAGIMRWLDVLVVGVYVFQEVGEPFAVALMLFLRMAPMLLLGAFVGALAERADPRRLLIVGLGLLAVVYSVLAVLAVTGALELWQLGLGVVLSGVFWTMELPVRRTLLGEIAGLDRLGGAMGLESATNNATRMVGPLAGGALMDFVGIAGAFALGVALYGFAVLLMVRTRSPGPAVVAADATIVANIREGLRTIRGERRLIVALVVTVVTNLFGFAYVSMVPVIGEVELGLTALPIGVLMSAEGLGALLGSLMVAYLARPRWFAIVFVGGSLIYISAILVFSLSSWFTLSLLVLFVGGFGIASFGAMQSALVLANTPRQMRTRVMGVLVMGIGMGPVGILHVGLLAEWLGAANAVTVMALEGLLALAIVIVMVPETRRPAPPAV